MVNGIPNHVAIIMDGNGRWATNRGLSRVKGHRAGFEATKKIVDHAIEAKVGVLSLFAFSTENWFRPRFEIDALMGLFSKAIDEELDSLHERAVRVRFIGERERLASSLQKKFQQAEALTANNKGMILQLAVSYGGRYDIMEACKRIAEKCLIQEMQPDDIDESIIAAHLVTSDVPDPDLFIRTSGEERISNFFLWQAAYSELYFTDVLWPDFTPQDFDEALNAFVKRNRRFGREQSC